MSSLFSINSPLWEMTDKLVRFLWLSILWSICSIPVVTMGASTTALYSVTLKYVRGEEGYLTSSFFRAFRENFRQSTIVWQQGSFCSPISRSIIGEIIKTWYLWLFSSFLWEYS